MGIRRITGPRSAVFFTVISINFKRSSLKPTSVFGISTNPFKTPKIPSCTVRPRSLLPYPVPSFKFFSSLFFVSFLVYLPTHYLLNYLFLTLSSPLIPFNSFLFKYFFISFSFCRLSSFVCFTYFLPNLFPPPFFSFFFSFSLLLVVLSIYLSK